MKFLIFGLGNIGKEYEKTRHNVGFDILDFIAEENQQIFESKRYANVAKFNFRGRQIFLIKPTTYMNLSGKCVRYWLQEENVDIQNSLIICDDISLDVGKLRIRTKGSDGGHNGLSDIIDTLGTQEFTRMRIGIGNNFPKGAQVDYVLGKMKEDERKVFETLLPKAYNAVKSFCFEGVQRAMNLYNN